jgi:hypothetical protein
MVPTNYRLRAQLLYFVSEYQHLRRGPQEKLLLVENPYSKNEIMHNETLLRLIHIGRGKHH